MIRNFTYKYNLLVISVFLFLGYVGTKSVGAEAKEPTETAKGWRVIGPGGGGGVFHPTINPADENHLFACCDMTGAYVSHDGGTTWRMFNLQTGITDFAFAEGEPDTIYAATNGSLHSEDRGKLNSGLFRSEDRGGRWRLIYPAPKTVKTEGWLKGTVSKIRIDPANSDNIYIGVSPLRRFMGRDRSRSRVSAQLMVSTNRGKSWRLLARLPGRSVHAILPGSWWGKEDEVIVFTERGGVRVSTESGEKSNVSLPVKSISGADGGSGPEGSVLYVLSGMRQAATRVVGGIYRSTDGGASWTQANPDLSGGKGYRGQLPRFRSIGVCRYRPEVIYLSCGSYQGQYGTLKSETAGDSWDWVYHAKGSEVISNNLEGSWLTRDHGPGWGGSPISLGVAPTNPDICYSSDNGSAHRTVNGGKKWVQVYSNNNADGSVSTRGLDVTTCYGVHFDPFDEKHFFISYTDIGLFHTLDGGESWYHSIRGVPSGWVNTCYWLTFDPDVKGRLWTVWANAHDLPRTKMFSRQGFGRNVGGVAVSNDGGKSWRKSTNGMPQNTICTHILLDPDSPADSRTLYTCVFDKGVFKSTDGGGSWKAANKGLGANKFAWQMRRVSSGRLYLIVSRGQVDGKTIDGALYKSDNEAQNWQKVRLAKGVNAPADLLIDPVDEKVMYLSCWPRTVQGQDTNGGLYRSDDGGKNWKQVFDEKIRVSAAGMDRRQRDTIYINTFHNSAFRSDNRGEDWYRLEGYNFKWGQRAIPDPHHPGMLYLTTYGGSVFYGPAGGVPGAFEDIENYPVSR
ncbi:MAG: VPS10 domain-containing protein [Planctomycetota bacterium]|jgi:photosystem II stability/assembly factor-like uncharacterized protein